MKAPPPLSPELEALLAPHRRVLPLSPWVEARAIARASAAAPARSAARVFARPWWVFAAVAGAVLVLGAGAYAARAWIGVPSSPEVTDVAESAPPAQTTPAAPRTEVPVTVATEAPARRRVVSKAVDAPARPTNAELRLLLAARQDVTNGKFAGALATIGEHARRFRKGALVEEREALRVKALAGLGRHEEAQRAATAFHARFPHSVFLSTFERMKEADR